MPADALTGTYDILLRDTLATGVREPQERPAGEFRVEAFRVPLLRARLQPVAAPWVRPAAIAFDVQVSHLAGGGAAGLPVRLRTATEPRTTTFPDFEDALFATGDVTPGREERGDAAARFESWVLGDDEAAGDEGGAPARGAARAGRHEQAYTLDAAGGGRITVEAASLDPGKPDGGSDTPRDLVAELEYRDPNGETLTAATRVPLWPSRILLAVKPDGWAASKDRLRYTVAAVDLAGKPLAGVRVRTDAFKREHYAHRRRLIGGFYAYDCGTETTRVGSGELCAGETDRQGLLFCDVTPPAAGNLILRAQAARRRRQPASVTRADAWVAAGDEWSFAGSDNDRIDLLPERKRYEPGETARFQVRTPFDEATALVTVEREGVLEAFVRTVKRDRPGDRGADQGRLRAQRVRVGAAGARAHRRRRADGDARPRQARVQDGTRRDPRGLGRARARSQGRARTRHRTRCAAGRRSRSPCGAPTAARRRAAPRSRSRRSTRACWSSCPTARGSCSTR